MDGKISRTIVDYKPKGERKESNGNSSGNFTQSGDQMLGSLVAGHVSTHPFLEANPNPTQPLPEP